MSRRPPEVPKALPCSLDAERSVLGSVLIDNVGFDLVSSRLQARHFFRDAHRRIWTVFGELRERSQPIDLVSVKHDLEMKGDLEECGGPAYVASLVDGVPRSSNVEYYAGIVIEKANKRALIGIGSKLVEGAYADAETDRELIARTDMALTDLASQVGVSSGAVPMADDLGALVTDLDYRVQHRGQIIGMPSGFPEVDLRTHGWQRRQMVVIAGQTSFGKSVLLLNLAVAIAMTGRRFVYYSFEMERRDLHYRLLASLSEIPLTQILWGNLSDAQYAKLSHALEVMHALPLEINDGASRSIVDVRAECRQIKADRGLDAIGLDHFQLMDGVDGENRTQQLAGVSRKIQGLGHELDVVTFTASQLTLPPSDAHREPQTEDLRECKSLGHDANIVAMLHPYKPSEARSGASVVPFKLLFRKNRGGGLGTVTLNLERDLTRFVPAEPPPPPVRAPKATKASTSVDRVWTGE